MNILIVGLGSIGKKHVNVIFELYSDALIFALRSHYAAEIYKSVINIYSIDDLPIIPDFIIISNLTSLHKETILAVMALKCPLFIEKPVLSDLTDIDLITQKIESLGIITYVACNMRFHPCIEFIREYLLDNKPRVNEVNIYCGSYLPDWRPQVDFRSSYSANNDLGGGVHLDLIHELDYTVWLFGFPTRIAKCKTDKSSLNIDAVDCARYVLEYSDFTVGITLNYFRRDAQRYLEIVTEEDTIYINLLNSTVESKLRDVVLFKAEEFIEATYKKQIKYFMQHLSTNTQPMNSFGYAAQVLKIAL